MAHALKVLIVEVAWPLALLLAAALDDEGMQVDVVEVGPRAMERKRQFEPDVVVIGLGASQPDAHSLVTSFAAEGDCGVVVVSVEDLESTHVASLDGGADDYIVEPVALRRVAARIRALHRRLSRTKLASMNVRVRVDLSKRGLIGPGAVMSTLTEAEFALLRTLLEADGAAVSRDRLGRIALKRLLHVADRSVDQLVLKLRRKLGQHGLAERTILSTRGLGYSIPEPDLFEVPRTQLLRTQHGDAVLPIVAAMPPPGEMSDQGNWGAGFPIYS